MASAAASAVDAKQEPRGMRQTRSRPEKLQRRMHICKMAEKVEGVKISGQNIVGKDCTAVLFGNIFYAKLTFLPPP